MISKKQFDKEIDEMFPIQVGSKYFCDGQEVLVLESAIVDGVEGFNVSVVISGDVKFMSNGDLKTKAELNLKSEE